jgi:hypothetical protein
VLRLIGVAAVGVLLYILAPSKSAVPFDHRKGGISHPEVSAT